jgi:guanylate kinase
MSAANPFPIILSSPSGAGKTTIAKAILAKRSDLGYSVSCTTRPPRPGEVEGRDYYFVSTAEFRRRLEQGLVSEIERVLAGGRHVVLDVDIQGAALLRQVFPTVVTIFILPPSGDILLARLASRKTESAETTVRRLESAVRELQAVEDYEYVVVNDSLEEAIGRVSAVVDAETARRERNIGLHEQVRALVNRVKDEIATHSS